MFLGLLGALAPSCAWAAESGLLHFRCSNDTNGTSWPIVVDTERRLVDSLPARISDASITWRNTKGGIFQLDRVTGKLQLSAPSSTGGYFLYYSCQKE
ncbi:MAG TPA: hypothetical protein VM782_23490 [Stellaceae bacterium]|nr:hypothetical protein [Stellaceae bacterium]